MSTTVRVNSETHRRLATLAQASGRRIQAILEDAVAAYEANEFWEQFNAGYERLAADPDQWSEVQAERMAEEPPLADRSEASD